MRSRRLGQVLKELGSRIQALRLAGGLTQEQAAARSRIDHKRWQKLEAGQANPTVRTLVRVADAIGVPFWQLMAVEGHAPMPASLRATLIEQAPAVSEPGGPYRPTRRRPRPG